MSKVAQIFTSLYNAAVNNPALSGLNKNQTDALLRDFYDLLDNKEAWNSMYFERSIKYIEALLPILTPKDIKDKHKEELVSILFYVLSNTSVQSHSTLKTALNIIVKLRKDNELMRALFNRDKGESLRLILCAHKDSPNSEIVILAAYIVMWGAYTAPEALAHFWESTSGVSGLMTLLEILRGTGRDDVITYIISTFNQLKKIRNVIDINFLSYYGKALVEVVKKGATNSRLYGVYNLGFVTLAELVQNKEEAESAIHGSGILSIMEKFYEAQLNYATDCACVLMYLDILKAPATGVCQRNIFMKAFASGKCTQRVLQFCFVNIGADKNTLGVLIRECGDTFIDFIQGSNDVQVYKKFVEIISVSDVGCMPNFTVYHKRINDLINNTIRVHGNQKFIAPLLSEPFTRYSWVAYDIRTMISAIQSTKDVDTCKETFPLYCDALRLTLERGDNQAVKTFILEDGIGVLCAARDFISEQQRNSVLGVVVNGLKALSKSDDTNLKELANFIKEKDAEHLLRGAHTMSPLMLAMVCFIVDQRKEDVLLQNESASNLAFRTLESNSKLEALLESCKVINAISKRSVVSRDFAIKVKMLYFANREKESVAKELKQALCFVRDKAEPVSLYACLDDNEVVGLLDKLKVNDYSTVNFLREFLLPEGKSNLFYEAAIRLFRRHANVFQSFDNDFCYEEFLRRTITIVCTCPAASGDGMELIKEIVRNSLKSKDYYSQLWRAFNSDYIRRACDTNTVLKGVGSLAKKKDLISDLERYIRPSKPEEQKEQNLKFMRELLERNEIYPFLNTEELLGPTFSLMNLCLSDVFAFRDCMKLCRLIVTSSEQNRYNMSPNDYMIMNFMIEKIDDTSVQEDGIQILSHSENMNIFNNKKRCVNLAKSLMKRYAEDSLIQENLSAVLNRICDKENTAEIIYYAFNILGVNLTNSKICENILGFLSDKGHIKAIKDETAKNSQYTTILLNFLDNEGCRPDLSAKALRVLRTILKIGKIELYKEQWNGMLVPSVMRSFFSLGFNDEAKACAIKILSTNKDAIEKFVRFLSEKAQDECKKHTDVWRVVNNYTPGPEDRNETERKEYLSKLKEKLDSWTKSDAAPDPFELSDIMKKERGDKSVSMKSLRVLDKFVNEKKFCADFSNSEGIKHVKKIMVRHGSEKEVQSIGFRVLSVFSDMSQYILKITKDNGEKFLFDKFTECSWSKATQLNILHIMSRTANLEHTQEGLLEPVNLLALFDFTKSIDMPEHRKNAVDDVLSILKRFSEQKKLRERIPLETLNYLDFVYNLEVDEKDKDDKKSTQKENVLKIMYNLSSSHQFCRVLTHKKWLSMLMNITTNNMTSSMAESILGILGNVLHRKIMNDDEDDDSDSEEQEGLNRDIAMGDDGNDAEQKKDDTTKTQNDFVANLDFRQFYGVLKTYLQTETGNIYKNATKLLSNLLSYPMFREKVDDNGWLCYSVEILKKVIENKKILSQKKTLNQVCLLLWDLTDKVIATEEFPSTELLTNFIVSVLGSKTVQDRNIKELCVAALGSILAHKKAQQENMSSLGKIKEYVTLVKRDLSSKIILAFSDSISKKEDKRAVSARKAGLCTKVNIPGCDDDCKGKHGGYCRKCCVAQELYLCRTCNDKKTYCNFCADAYHASHKKEKLFGVGTCQSEKGVADSKARQSLQKDDEARLQKKMPVSDEKKVQCNSSEGEKMHSKEKAYESDSEHVLAKKENNGKHRGLMGEPARKKRKTCPPMIKFSDDDDEEDDTTKEERAHNRFLDDMISANTSRSMKKVEKEYDGMNPKSISFASALEHAGFKGVASIVEVCAENAKRAFDAYAYDDSITEDQARAVCSLQLQMSDIKKADPANTCTPREMLLSALSYKQRNMISATRELLVLTLSGLRSLGRVRCTVLFRAVPLTSSLFNFANDSSSCVSSLSLSSNSGRLSLNGEPQQQQQKHKRKRLSDVFSSIAGSNVKSLGGLTFASTKMSAIMDMLGADASKYAVVTLVGRVWGYDITAFHFESRDYCEIVLEPELRVRIIDVAQSCGEQLFITAEVLDVSEGEDDGGGLILKAIAPPK